jgi:hypothetical protein
LIQLKTAARQSPHEGPNGFFEANCDGAPFLQLHPQALDKVAIVLFDRSSQDSHGRFIAGSGRGWLSLGEPEFFCRWAKDNGNKFF